MEFLLIIPIYIILFLLTWVLYLYEKFKERSNNDDFKRGGLFSKYGSQLYSSMIPIQVDHSKTSKSKAQIIHELTNGLKQELLSQFGTKTYFKLDEITVKDLKVRRDQRTFYQDYFYNSKKK